MAVVTAKQATLNAVLDGRSDQGTAADETSVAAELDLAAHPARTRQPPSDTPGAARDPTPDGRPRPGDESGDDESPGTAGGRVLAGLRPGRASASPRAGQGMAGSERALLTVSEQETTHAARLAEQAVFPSAGSKPALVTWQGQVLTARLRPVTGSGRKPRTLHDRASRLCEEDQMAPKPLPAARYTGRVNEVTVRQWREAQVDPDKVRAWCRDTGRA